jgi:CHASE1-domain containing sensor protein
MRKFSWQTMLIFIVSLLLAVVLLGLGTAYIANLKQQRRQLSDKWHFRLCGRQAAPPASQMRLALQELRKFLAVVC